MHSLWVVVVYMASALSMGGGGVHGKCTLYRDSQYSIKFAYVFSIKKFQ